VEGLTCMFYARDMTKSLPSEPDPDHTSFDRLLPHPVYAKQLWVSILNPSATTFAEVAVPLLAEAHDRLTAARARHHRAADDAPDVPAEDG